MNSTSSNTSVSIGGPGLLGVAFIVLKLMGVISWPWLWVLSPIWIPIALAILVVLIVVIATN